MKGDGISRNRRGSPPIEGEGGDGLGSIKNLWRDPKTSPRDTPVHYAPILIFQGLSRQHRWRSTFPSPLFLFTSLPLSPPPLSLPRHLLYPRLGSRPRPGWSRETDHTILLGVLCVPLKRGGSFQFSWNVALVSGSRVIQCVFTAARSDNEWVFKAFVPSASQITLSTLGLRLAAEAAARRLQLRSPTLLLLRSLSSLLVSLRFLKPEFIVYSRGPRPSAGDTVNKSPSCTSRRVGKQGPRPSPPTRHFRWGLPPPWNQVAKNELVTEIKENTGRGEGGRSWYSLRSWLVN